MHLYTSRLRITSYSITATPVMTTARMTGVGLAFLIENLYDEAETDAEVHGLANGVEYRFSVVANTAVWRCRLTLD